MTERCLKLYHWEDAPEAYRALCARGGDDDWVLVAPRALLEDADGWPTPFWECVATAAMEAKGCYVPGWGWADVHHLADTVVVMFTHA